jgi:hypothetical protein
VEKWEYKIVSAEDEGVEQALNKLGAQGWEAVGLHYEYVEEFGSQPGHHVWRVLLKRRKQER